jgi:F0F1-type ATP synthase membrane subunit b/b'
MDAEFKAYLDAWRQELSDQIAESRQHAEQLNQATRQELTRQIVEFRQQAEQLNQATRRDLMGHVERLIQETRQDLTTHAERLNHKTRQDLAEQIRETRDDLAEQIRQTRVLIENLRHDLQAVAEGVLTVNDKLDRVTADHEARITRLERRVP